MEATVCIRCGKRHWSRELCPAIGVNALDLAKAEARVAVTRELVESIVPKVVSYAVSDGQAERRVTNKSTSAQRMAKWRAAHPDENRGKQRDLMRKRRANG